VSSLFASFLIFFRIPQNGAFVHYEGEYEKGRRKNGVIKFGNGDIYEGEMKEEKNYLFHGFGTYENEIGKYQGQFVKGKMTSDNATFTFKNGDEYVGGFLNGKFYGKGIYTFSNGDVHPKKHF